MQFYKSDTCTTSCNTGNRNTILQVWYLHLISSISWCPNLTQLGRHSLQDLFLPEVTLPEAELIILQKALPEILWQFVVVHELLEFLLHSKIPAFWCNQYGPYLLQVTCNNIRGTEYCQKIQLRSVIAKIPNLCSTLYILYCILLYCIDGVVIATQCTATFFKIYCAPPNLDITRMWICWLNFAQRPIFSGLSFFNEPEISDSGPTA